MDLQHLLDLLQHAAARTPELVAQLASALEGRHYQLIVAVLGLAGLTVARAARPFVIGAMGEWRVRRLLRRTGLEAAHDLLLPHDNEAGWTQIDHLVRLPDGLLVIETKNWRGRLFGTAYDLSWTQRLGPWSYRHQNPLRQNHAHIVAVRNLTGRTVPVTGAVVMVGAGWFPRGLPDGCHRISGFRRHLRARLGPRLVRPGESSRIDAAWNRVLAAASTRRRDRRQHRRTVRGYRPPRLRLERALAYAIAAGSIGGLLLRW